MGKIAKAASFDYSLVDADTKGKLIALAGQFNRAMADHKKSGMALGEIVSDAHELLAGNGRDGSFAGWVESSLGVSRQTAYNYMWTWQKFGKCKTIIHFDDAALYALAAPSVPDKAVKEAEKRADKGEKITLDKAKEIVKKFREVQERAAPKPPSQSDSPPAQPTADDDDDREWLNDHVREPEKPEGWKPPEGVKQFKDTFDPDAVGDRGESELAKKNKALAHSYRDKLARAICDYHEVNANRSERDRLVKLVQGVELW